LNDRALMLQVRKGSRTAFSALVDRHSGRLMAYFYRQSGDRDLAEDCTQEVFVRLYRARERYGPTASFPTFLYTIARNYWIDVVRSRRARPREALLGSDKGEESPLSWNEASTDDEPEAAAEAAEQVVRLRAALSTLGEGQREAVQLGVIEGLPYAEVADILGVPVGTVKSRVHAAIRVLRQRMGGEADAEGEQPPRRSRRTGNE
jgi:RNA polymerase sigma-70 factor (ECF subfamily)